MTQENKKKKGFTLIELLVVVAIISLLTSVVLASLSIARSKAQDSKVLAELSQIRTAFELYYNDNGRYPVPPSSGSYCLGTCKLAGATLATFSSTNPAFTYKPSSNQSIAGGNQGFVYTYTNPTTQNISFPLSNGFKSLGTSPAVYNVQVGKWLIQSSNN